MYVRMYLSTELGLVPMVEVWYVRMHFSVTCLIHTSKGTQNQYLLSEVLNITVGLCT